MESLKEWATVIRALEDGNQTVILRKGGILETASGFKVSARKFLLFPTYEHQEESHIKKEFVSYIDDVKKDRPADGTKVTSYAEILGDCDVQAARIDELEEFHIWSREYVKSRINWMPQKPLKAMLLRVFRIPGFNVPAKTEHQGCKSWIDIDANIPAGEPVLNEAKAQASLERFTEITS